MSQFDPDRCFQELLKAGEAWADAEATAQQLEELKKVVLADLMVGEGSVASREQKALASDEYKRHVKGMVEARRSANRARVRYKSLEVLTELRRTQQANLRAEMNLR
jgi:hypothetical protein